MRLKEKPVEGECSATQCHLPSTILISPPKGPRVELCDRHWQQRCDESERSES